MSYVWIISYDTSLTVGTRPFVRVSHDLIFLWIPYSVAYKLVYIILSPILTEGKEE